MNFFIVVARGSMDDIPLKAFEFSEQGQRDAEAYAKSQGEEIKRTGRFTPEARNAVVVLGLDTSSFDNISVYCFRDGILDGYKVVYDFA